MLKRVIFGLMSRTLKISFKMEMGTLLNFFLQACECKLTALITILASVSRDWGQTSVHLNCTELSPTELCICENFGRQPFQSRQVFPITGWTLLSPGRGVGGLNNTDAWVPFRAIKSDGGRRETYRYVLCRQIENWWPVVMHITVRKLEVMDENCLSPLFKEPISPCSVHSTRLAAALGGVR